MNKYHITTADLIDELRCRVEDANASKMLAILRQITEVAAAMKAAGVKMDGYGELPPEKPGTFLAVQERATLASETARRAIEAARATMRRVEH